MQTANILLSLAGEHGNTVPMFDVTPAEVAVLNVIHGNDSVKEIEPLKDIKRSHSVELERLQRRYGKPQTDGRGNPVSMLFPGAAARVFERFDELNIPEDFFKAEKRVSAGGKSRKVKAEEPTTANTASEDTEDDDGIEEMGAFG